MKISWFFLLIFLNAGLSARAQCPPQNIPGSHQVQKGETLYRIAKTHGVTVDELRLWNQLQGDVISLCQELIVKAPATEGSVPAAPASISYPAQSGPTHIVQPGETLEDIAALYGYTALRFRLFNNLKADQQASTGMVLKTSDCSCPPADGSMASNVPASYQTLENTDYPTSVFLEQPGQSKLAASGNANDKLPGAYESAENQAIKLQESAAATAGEPSPIPGADFKPAQAPYLQAEERSMTDEINLLRTNPAAYITAIDHYLNRLAATPEGEVLRAACQELKEELRKTKPLNLLQPMPCLYDAAVKHGADLRKSELASHKGTDGSWPWERAKKACPEMADGNEIISSSQADIRKAVIELLADADFPSRGHRRMLLSKDWNYLACHKVGTVGPLQDNWILLFGRK